jgi:hypothetical protein|tara:strand:+ start:1414 stop:1680 length:267 start_codon:yes stop_codon:yes gene_type:complete
LIIIEEDGKMRKIFDFNKDGKTDIDDFKHIMLRYEIILVGGMLLILLPLLNMAGYLQLDSDTFWILAGVVISAEALLEIINERRKRKE